MGKVKAKVEVKGPLAIVVTEYGQKAVIPADTLCSFIARYDLEVEGLDVECPRVESMKLVGVEVDYADAEEEG